MKRKYRHLFFDLDNTLWDFEQNALVSLAELFDKFKLDSLFQDFDHFYSLYSYRNKQLWELYPQGLITRKELNLERFLYPLTQVGCSDEELALKLSDDYLELCPTKTILKPYAIELLTYLRPHYKIHILTNGFSKVQHKKITACRISEFIDNMYLSETVGYHKPDKRVFDYAIKSSNARKSESIMIGDSFEADIFGAKNAGIHQIFVTSSSSCMTEIPFAPTYTVTSLEEIKNIL